jgi:hypothetical protein
MDSLPKSFHRYRQFQSSANFLWAVYLILIEGAEQRLPQHKDVWVCWALETLFSMPNAHPMAFKGGTSLSKVYDIIDRFSEDVDITLDYKHFDDVDYYPNLFTAIVNFNRVRIFCGQFI